jgi:transposase-like protein
MQPNEPQAFTANLGLSVPPPATGRRRAFTLEQKRQILDEAAKPGGSISAVARRLGISTRLVFHWKRSLREMV